MKRILTNALAVAISLPYFSADISARTVTARVLSSADSTAVAGAQCRLLAGDKEIGMDVADVNGNVRLTTDNTSAIRMTVNARGFISSEVLLTEGDRNIALGDIFLLIGNELQELTVEGNRVSYSKGNTIVFPSPTDAEASNNAVSLLQKLPLAGLHANPIDRSLTVNGGSPVILIDGVPSDLTAFNALRPKDIEKVEYSPITPARYADKGTHGFISVTLKKRKDGGAVDLWGRSALASAFVDAALSFSYHHGPSQFTLTYSPSWRNNRKTFDTETERYIAPDFQVDIFSETRNPFWYFNNPIDLKYVFNKDGRTIFSARFAMGLSHNKSHTDGPWIDSYLGESLIKEVSSGRGTAPSLDLFLHHDFNSKNSLEAQVVGTLSLSDSRWRKDYDYNSGTNDLYQRNIDARRRSLITELLYIHLFTDYISLTGGYQNTISYNRNHYLDTDYNPILTENNNYVYAALGLTAGRFYLSASSGMKMFWIKNDENHRRFIRNRSQISMSWNSGNHWNLSASFFYGPGIPGLAELTDHPQQITPYLWSNGNPDLKVQENFNYNLNASYKLRKFTADLMLRYDNIRNGTMTDVTYQGDKRFLSQAVNMPSFRQAGGTLRLQIDDLWGFGASGSISYNHSVNSIGGFRKQLNSIGGMLQVWWSKGPFSASYYKCWPGKQLWGYTIAPDSENADMLGFYYRLGSHWQFGIEWLYMFSKNGWTYSSDCYSDVTPSHSYREIKDICNQVQLTVKYETNFGSLFHRNSRRLNNADHGSSVRGL